jgi:arginase family enzyme
VADSSAGAALTDDAWDVEGATGFGGAPVRALESIAEAGAGCFVGIDRELSRAFGTPNDGAAVFIRRRSARMAPWAEHARTMGHRPAYDVGVLRGAPVELRDDLITLGARLRGLGHVPVAIGCDHTSSYALALGVASSAPVAYVYFDAHLDLGLHLGEDPSAQRLHNGNFVGALCRSDGITEVINVGARAWSTHAQCYRDEAGVRVIEASSREAIVHALEPLRGRDVHVSVDADVLDPAWMPNVCCPEPFGLEPRVLLEVLGWLGRACRVRGADFSELVADEGRGYTAEIAMRCMHELLYLPGMEDSR